MKTKTYIAVTLIAMVFTSSAVFAQPARRPASQEGQERTTATRTPTREVKKKTSHATQPARKVQPQQAQRQRNAQPARVVQPQQAQRQRNAQPARKVQPQQAQPQRNAQPARKVQPQQAQRQRAIQETRTANVTTSHNPRSTYRKPDSKVYVKDNRNTTHHRNKFATKRYYGGHHYHYVYPTRNVKIHYHHDTYLHNYHVLYYPAHTNIYWTRHMYRNYRRWYPEYTWHYNFGHRIHTISVFDAKYNLGEVAHVYGRVYAAWYNEETRDYLLFFGGNYPYQQFTVVLPARIARKFSWRPERYFLGQHITVTGLITTFDGSPEILVRDRQQIGVY